MKRLVLVALVLLANVFAPAAARAHIGGDAFIHVPLDHVMPGDTFPIIAADLGSNATISLRMVQGDHVTDLGTVVAEPDGHFQATAQLPADFPHGYAELVAAADDGSEVSTYVLVGPREQAPAGGPPASATASEWWLDPSVLVLVAILAIAGVAVFAVTIRSARREPVLAAPARARPVPRKGGTKGRRKR